MCIFRAPKPKAPPIPPAIKPRIEGRTELPQAQELVKEGEQADVQIGSSAKESGAAAAKKQGEESLKIALNTPGVDERAGEQGGITGA